jgi:hypothetical protein
MTIRILRQDVNAKDGVNSENAGQKLNPEFQEHLWGYDDVVRMIAVAGLNDDSTNSELDLITCTRDVFGNNRLAVDTSGLAQANINQTYINVTGYPLASGTTLYTVPANKTFFLLGIHYSQGGLNSNVALDVNGSLYFLCPLSATASKGSDNLVISGGSVLLAVAQNGVIKYNNNNAGATAGITIWGYIQ